MSLFAQRKFFESGERKFKVSKISDEENHGKVEVNGSKAFVE